VVGSQDAFVVDVDAKLLGERYPADGSSPVGGAHDQIRAVVAEPRDRRRQQQRSRLVDRRA
jgi:hypothetical protein